MKLYRSLAVAGLAAAALVMVGCNQATGGSSDEGTKVTPKAAWMLNFDNGDLTGITVYKGTTNTYSGALNVSAVDKEATTNFTPVDENLDAGAEQTTLDLGTKSLKFEFASSVDHGHVVLSLKNLVGMDRTGRTGLTFTLKFVDAPVGAALGLMPHLRYNDGTSENAVAFGCEKWYFKTDALYFKVSLPFSAFTKPSYGLQSETKIADLPASVVFNQLDFDMRIAPEADGKFVQNTKYSAIIDNVGFY